MADIIRCIIVDDEPVARDVLSNHLTRIENIEIVAKCKNAVEAFQAVNSHEVDLVFLDINMPEISGLLFARAVKQDVKVIFTTAYREYAVDGFDLQVVDYLLKPISFERLLQAVNKYMGETTTNKGEIAKEVHEKKDSIFVRADRRMNRIRFPEIDYIESLSDYIRIHIGEKTVVTRETISSIEAKLPQQDFIRVHRSFIVAIRRIDSFTKEFIEACGKQIPISRSYRTEVLKKLSS